MSAPPGQQGNHVALTFDDGPHPDSTPGLLRALADARAPATFFVLGDRAAAHPGLLGQLHEAGMTIGNHSWSHPRLTGLPDEEVEDQIARTQRVVGELTGVTPRLFRPPYGDTDARVAGLAAAQGLAEVMWSVDSEDWNGASGARIAETAERVEPGGIILMHDGGYGSTVAAVPLILRTLARRGLRPGRVRITPQGVARAGP